jgi:ATP-binding cassette, subfamily B, bacterial
VKVGGQHTENEKMSGHQTWSTVRSFSRDPRVAQQQLAAGTWRRVFGCARPYRAQVIVFLGLVVLSSVLMVLTPLLLRQIIDEGVTPGDRDLVIRLSLWVAGIAVLDAVLVLVQRWLSARIGEGLIYDLRTQVFDHVLHQPIAFFARARTGALVSRLTTDVVGAQRAFTSTLSGVVSNVVSVVLVVVAMLVLSWQVTLGALLLVPVFLLPARWVGGHLQRLTRDQMDLNAELGTRMTERFDVAGALLVKLFASPDRESTEYRHRAGQVRDVGIRIAMGNRFFLTALTLVASLATALVYGAGGLLAIGGSLTVGTLLALAALLGRLYGPLTALSNVRVDVMTALVSFERVFELMDLRPGIVESEDARDLPEGPLDIELEDVHFTFPSAQEACPASLDPRTEPVTRNGGEVLHGICLRVGPGQLVALVGPSGSGKTTLTHLVSRLYDPTSGAVRLGGIDLRSATLGSVRAAVGTVTQDAHLFHDTIRANLAYADPGAGESRMIQALRAALIWDLVESLPDGLDTVVGDRGHRLSGGEKQRIALARLLLKAPPVVVLDEATAHLDSGSEAAVQQALDHALAGRTALVIAHRLSTVRAADRILVVDGGRIVESGRHCELLARAGLYARLHRTQFSSGSD